MVRAPAVVVLVLLAATAVAFVRTQQQKLERGPIGRVAIDRVFSPVCDCDSNGAAIAIRLRSGDTVTLEIVDDELEHVRTLARRERSPAGDHVWRWDGLDEDGRLAADGTYRPRLTLASGARTFVLPNDIVLDSVAPQVTRIQVEPRRFSPDGDRRLDRVIVRYALSEPANALLSVDGELVERTRFRRTEGVRAWNGKSGGKALPAGLYELTLAGEDAAGNVGVPSRPAAVAIRFIELARPVVRVRTRARFGIGVLSDARSYRWRFAGGSGRARPGLLVLRAPRAPGSYTLFVSANGHGARARVVVRPRPRPPADRPQQAGR